MNFSFTKEEDKKEPLQEFGRNLNDEAALNKLDPIIGRDEEIRRVIRILSRKTKNNPILIGEPGVGKTAIVEGLAQKIVSGDVPENLKDKEIIELDVAALIAGASYQGQFEKRLKSVMDAIKESSGQTIVFIDEIHTLVGTGKNAQGGMDAAQILKPMLARGQMKLIGATTLDEHREYIEKDAAFERRLQSVMVNEPTEEDSLTILRGIKDRFENYHRVKISDSALVQAVKLSSRYITERYLPDKAIDLIDEAAAGIQTQINSKPEELEKLDHKIATLEMEKAAISKEKDQNNTIKISNLTDDIKKTKEEAEKLRVKWEKEKDNAKQVAELKETIELSRIQQQKYQADGEYEKASILLYKSIPELEHKLKRAIKERKSNLIKEVVTKDDISDVVSRWTGVPVSKLLQNQKDRLMTLEKHLSLRVKGQEEALKIVSDAIIRSRAGINDPDRPIGSFIFMGPTGVGKTEVARSLAYELFDSEKSMVRIDMSEYMEEHSVARLIGSPPGYVGHESGGQLTEAVRRKPYSIVLFDEIEKSHPKVLDILLQILDDGMVTDSKGKQVNFKNTIVVMTTNIGSLEILENKNSKKALELIKAKLRPEFINRIDEIIVFNPLGKNAIKMIAMKELEKLSLRLEENEIKIEFNNDVIEKISIEGYDHAFGARPIKRYIQKHIQSIVAKKIISGEIKTDIDYVAILEDNIIVYKEAALN